ncbi:hypothetical protein B0T25DRAFT_534372 [Lasiosphaeria hispida]|uniref:Secreted protein n=1 Tax=Lasiosphaeria hispida TaxID=260671 RepID=A0AAJ0HR81_9PEZI|nr:hypothetical protein B0T25DRAFT_534372 [Lasiosphaeria hispida]
MPRLGLPIAFILATSRHTQSCRPCCSELKKRRAPHPTSGPALRLIPRLSKPGITTQELYWDPTHLCYMCAALRSASIYYATQSGTQTTLFSGSRPAQVISRSRASVVLLWGHNRVPRRHVLPLGPGSTRFLFWKSPSLVKSQVCNKAVMGNETNKGIMMLRASYSGVQIYCCLPKLRPRI